MTEQSQMSTEAEMLGRYTRAVELSAERLPALMRNRAIEPQWLGDGDRFWYRRQGEGDPAADQFVLVDPDAGTRQVFDSIDDLRLPPGPNPTPPGTLPTPDARGMLFRRDHDLWFRHVATGDEQRLTHTGEPAFAWAEFPENSNMNVPFKRMGLNIPPAGTAFSPSGRYVVTMRMDQRAMAQRQMLEHVAVTGGARPVTHAIRVQLDDEPTPPPSECLIIDLISGACVEVDVSDGLCDSLMVNGSRHVQWLADESAVFMLNHSMGRQDVALVKIDPVTGARRDVVRFDEAPLYEPNQFLYSLPLWHVLGSGSEAILFSQRDGWGHLYLYDLATGDCRHAISNGALVVRDLLRVDEQRREVTYVAGCAEGGHNPYWRKLYRASLDGGRQVLLTPEPADHELAAPAPDFFRNVFGQGKAELTSVSPSGRYFIDHLSTVSQPPVILLRDAARSGEVVLELERTDVSRLEAAGYVAPTSFCVKADDGVTDLWGILALPRAPLDRQSIPVIDYIYAGFQIHTTPPAYLGGARPGGAQSTLSAYNELGFAMVMLDGRGTPGRSREFRQWTHRHGHTRRGLEDHCHAIRELAKRHPVLDLQRVGIVGHSYGGYNSARCMLLFPDFFKVGISSAGVHVASKSPHGAWNWFMGADYDRGSSEYQQLGNVHLADQLRGQMLIACGEIDENATVDHSYALADALIKAGKRFDLKIWPGFNHYQFGPYVAMTFWDHFVQHLLGEPLPRQFTPGMAASAR